MGRTKWSSLLASAALFGGLLLTSGPASAGSSSGEEASNDTVDMKLEVAVDRFEVDGRRTYASGPVTLRATQDGQTEEATVERMAMRVRGTRGTDGTRRCKILRLHLSESFVALLGLEVTTSDINVEITGSPKRALGKLFCKLSEGLKLNRKAQTRKTVQSLNRKLDGEELRLLRVSAKLHPRELSARTMSKRAPGDGGPRCQILDLDLGPLELDLLGLAVDLYGNDKESPIHIDADADPNGGVLGEALCQVSGGPTEPEPQPTP